MRRNVLFAAIGCLVLALAVSGCACSAPAKRPGAPGTIRTSPAADWPTRASVDASVALLLPEGPGLDAADVTADVFGDSAVTEGLSALLGSTLFHADMPEPRQYLTAVVYVAGSARNADGIDVYAALYEQWWRVGPVGPEKMMASSGPAVLRLHQEGLGYELSSIDRPGDGAMHAPGLEALFPAWVRDPVEQLRRGASSRFEQITNEAGQRWYGSLEASAAR